MAKSNMDMAAQQAERERLAREQAEKDAQATVDAAERVRPGNEALTAPTDEQRQQAVATANAQANAEQLARGMVGVAPTPTNLAGIAATFDPALAGAPPAVIGVAVNEASTRQSLEALQRANERIVPGSVGYTVGPEETTFLQLQAGDVNGERVIKCTNCNREWDWSPALMGATIQCLCGTQLNVPIER